MRDIFPGHAYDLLDVFDEDSFEVEQLRGTRRILPSSRSIATVLRSISLLLDHLIRVDLVTRIRTVELLLEIGFVFLIAVEACVRVHRDIVRFPSGLREIRVEIHAEIRDIAHAFIENGDRCDRLLNVIEED